MHKHEHASPGRFFSTFRKQWNLQVVVKIFITTALNFYPFISSFLFFFFLPPDCHLINSQKSLEFWNGTSNISARIGKAAWGMITIMKNTQEITLCIDSHPVSFMWGIKLVQRISWWQIWLSMDYKWENYKNINMQTM